jgi:hypothetical protein
VPDLAQQSDPPQADPSPALVELRTLLERGRRGDLDALPALRRALDLHPEVWRHVGDLAACAEHAWINLAAGPDLLMKESLVRKLAELKAEIVGTNPTRLERLLVDRVGATWLQLAYADAAAAQSRDVSIKQAELAIKRQGQAHRRHLTALAALATVRRLLPSAGGAVLAMGESLTPLRSTDDIQGDPARPPIAATGTPGCEVDATSLALVGAVTETERDTTARTRRRTAS